MVFPKLASECPMEPPKDTIFYQNILMKSPTGVWETSEQQFQRELLEGQWVHVGYETSYHIWRHTHSFILGKIRDESPIRDVAMAVCKVYKNKNSSITYLRDAIKKETYTAQEWENMVSWNPSLKKYH